MRYFEKIQDFYILEPHRELNILFTPNPNTEFVGIKVNKCDILLGMNPLRYRATENQLKIIQCMQKYDPGYSYETQLSIITQLWAQLGIDFLVDILTKIFALKLSVNESAFECKESRFSRSYNATGSFDIFYRRKMFGGGPDQNGYMYVQRIGKNLQHFRKRCAPI